MPDGGEAAERLEQQRGLADPRLAAEQRGGPQREATAEDPVELADPGAPARRPHLATSAIGRAAPGWPGLTDARLATAETSASVPQASHSGQRPSQRGLSAPHASHRWIDLVFIGAGCHPGTDTYGDPMPCVGFDLDMTLVDSRPGIVATLRARQEIGDPALAQPELLDLLLRSNVDPEFALRYGDDGLAHADRFRALYVDLGVPGTDAAPRCSRSGRRGAQPERST